MFYLRRISSVEKMEKKEEKSNEQSCKDPTVRTQEDWEAINCEMIINVIIHILSTRIAASLVNLMLNLHDLLAL